MNYQPFSYGLVCNIDLNHVDMEKCKKETAEFLKTKEQESLWYKHISDLGDSSVSKLKKVEFWETSACRKQILKELHQIHDLKTPIAKKEFDYVDFLKKREALLKEVREFDKVKATTDSSYCVIC